MVLELGIADKVKQLRREGLRPHEKLAAQITRAGTAALAPLLELATNLDQLHEDAPECYAPIHALRLLGELNTVEIIEPLLEQFPVELDYEDERLPQVWAEEVPQIIGHLGAAAIEPLWAFADDASHTESARSTAFRALSYLTAAAPESRETIVAGLRERLAAEEDKTMRSSQVTALANLGVAELYSELMGMYRAGQIDTEIIPAGAMRQLLLSDSAKRLACALHPLWERYDQHGPFPNENE